MNEDSKMTVDAPAAAGSRSAGLLPRALALLLLAGLLGLGFASLGQSARLAGGAGTDADELTDLGQVPQFQLTDQNGKPFGLKELAGRWWVVDFIFTTCRSSCPVMTQHMDELRKKAHELPGVTFVSISVDPERDTPEALARYAATRPAAPGADWRLLTGDRKAIQELALRGLRLGFQENPQHPEEPILHSRKFVLVDGTSHIRGYYDGMMADEVTTLDRHLHRVSAGGDVRPPRPMILPTINAMLNATTATLLLLGYLAIRRGRVSVHRRLMLSAFSVSVLFLVGYLTHHALHGSTKFQGHGWVRGLYFSILLSHTVLAALVVPMVLATLWYGLTDARERHRRLAVRTFPIWLYVSVTGVMVYWMLYQM